MTLVDANIVLRWLLGDHKELSRKAEIIVEGSEEKNLVIADMILAEIVYVLRGKGYDREQTTVSLGLTARTPAFAYESPELMLDSLTLYSQTNLDFADCYLLARAQRQKISVQTFDKQLVKKLSQKS